MPRAYSSGVIPAPVDRVWAAVRDFGSIASFVEPIATSALVQQPDLQTGAVRRLTLGDGGSVDERLVALDDHAHVLTYEFAGDNPFGARNYRATVRVAPVTDTAGSFVEWSAEFDADRTDEAQLVDLFANGVFASGIAGLREFVTHAGSPGR